MTWFSSLISSCTPEAPVEEPTVSRLPSAALRYKYRSQSSSAFGNDILMSTPKAASSGLIVKSWVSYEPGERASGGRLDWYAPGWVVVSFLKSKSAGGGPCGSLPQLPVKPGSGS